MDREGIKGEPTEGLAFYDLLCLDDEFCRELGRAILAAGRLESALIMFLNVHAPDIKTTNATLGRLINFARRRQLLLKLLPGSRRLPAIPSLPPSPPGLGIWSTRGTKIRWPGQFLETNGHTGPTCPISGRRSLPLPPEWRCLFDFLTCFSPFCFYVK